MTKSKNTKRALLASVLSLMLCVVMLVGSTFAWFTDSVTSGKNKIVAGNLDVELEYSTEPADESSWTKVTEETNMFKEGALWEPGYTEVVYLRVKNAGTLALKYQFGINVASKKIGKTAEDADIDLANFIKCGVVEVEEKFHDGTAARNAVKDSAVLISKGYSSAEGHLTAGNSSKMLALVVYMPEDVTNEANHGAGKDAPEIYMGINLVATQDTVEEDSFGSNYDEKAKYKMVATAEDLTTAITDAKDGDVIALTSNITLDAPLTIDDAITINGNGMEITGQPITATADVKLENIVLSKPNNASKNASLVYASNGCENLTLEGVTFTDPQWEAIQATSNDLKTLTINNCTFTAANVDGADNKSGYGCEADQLVRFIHYQPKSGAAVDFTITNNTFRNCDKIGDKGAIAGIYFFGAGSTLTIGGNTFEDWAEEDISNAFYQKMVIGWPAIEALKNIEAWEGGITTFSLDK